MNFEDMWAKHDEVTKRLQKRWKKMRKQLKAEASTDDLVTAGSSDAKLHKADDVR